MNRRTPQSLLAVVRKAMAFDPAARYPSVEDLQRDFVAYQRASPRARKMPARGSSSLCS